jgi:hypothetical protein
MRRPSPRPSSTWRTFLEEHIHDIVAIDFFVVPMLTFRVLFGFLIVRHLCLPLTRPICSRRSPEVFVMEPTHTGHLHHPALARRLHAPWRRRVFGQG